jgi:hypothetical protein
LKLGEGVSNVQNTQRSGGGSHLAILGGRGTVGVARQTYSQL